MGNLLRPLAEDEASLIKSAHEVDKEFLTHIHDLISSAGWRVITHPKCVKPWTSTFGTFALEIPELSTTIELKYEWGVGGSSVREKWFAFPSLIAWAVRKGHLHTKRSILIIHVDTRIDINKGCLDDEKAYLKLVKEQCKHMSNKKHEILAFTVDEFVDWLKQATPNK